jgi:hypothetical protein
VVSVVRRFAGRMAILYTVVEPNVRVSIGVVLTNTSRRGAIYLYLLFFRTSMQSRSVFTEEKSRNSVSLLAMNSDYRP